MGHLRLGGMLWIIGGILSALLVLVTLDVPGIAAVVGLAGVVGMAIGYLLLRRPSPEVIRWSTIAGVAWLIVYGVLMLANLSHPVGETLTNVVLGTLGGIAALLAYTARADVAPA